MYCYTISSFYSLLPASYICRSTLQPVSLSQSSKRITAATFRECFTVNRIVFYVVRENHVVNFGAYHKIYKIFTLQILNIHPIWGSNPGPLDQKSNALSSALMGLLHSRCFEKELKLVAILYKQDDDFKKNKGKRKKKKKKGSQQSVVSIYGPLGYGPSTLPLRHSAMVATKAFVRREIRTPAHRSGLRPERSALDHSAILTSWERWRDKL